MAAAPSPSFEFLLRQQVPGARRRDESAVIHLHHALHTALAHNTHQGAQEPQRAPIPSSKHYCTRSVQMGHEQELPKHE